MKSLHKIALVAIWPILNDLEGFDNAVDETHRAPEVVFSHTSASIDGKYEVNFLLRATCNVDGKGLMNYI